jgi:hypothetical protein
VLWLAVHMLKGRSQHTLHPRNSHVLLSCSLSPPLLLQLKLLAQLLLQYLLPLLLLLQCSLALLLLL